MGQSDVVELVESLLSDVESVLRSGGESLDDLFGLRFQDAIRFVCRPCGVEESTLR